MDGRRLNTSQVLTSGILNIEPPESKVPDDATREHISEYEWSEESLREGLEKGGLTASMYYGCWDIWKTGDTFSGELLQYRRITDSFKGVSLDEALQKADEWACNCQG